MYAFFVFPARIPSIQHRQNQSSRDKRSTKVANKKTLTIVSNNKTHRLQPRPSPSRAAIPDQSRGYKPIILSIDPSFLLENPSISVQNHLADRAEQPREVLPARLRSKSQSKSAENLLHNTTLNSLRKEEHGNEKHTQRSTSLSTRFCTLP